MNKHAISIKWSDEDNSFVATIPGIKGLSAVGATREEALFELRIAADSYFEALEAAGKPIPKAEKEIPYSGQLRLRMPKTLHALLSSKAEQENVSLNTYIVMLLSQGHIEKKLLDEIETLKNFVETTYAEKMIPVNNNSRPVYKLKENDQKYGIKKGKK
jgi:antitoxin HicB